MSQLIYKAQPDFADIAPTMITAGDPVTQSLMQRLSHNAKFGSARKERADMGYWMNNQTVPTFVSPIDGYKYSRAETTYEYSRAMTRNAGTPFTPGQATLPPMANLNSGEGNLRMVAEDVVDATGLVSTVVVYRDVGANDHPTNDGLLHVWAWGQRMSALTMVPSPVPTDLDNALIVGGQPATQYALRAISDNGRFGAVRLERIFVGYFSNGGAPTFPIVSPVDGYPYSCEECTFQVMWRSTGAPQGGFTQGQKDWQITSAPSIVGRLLYVFADANDAGGNVTTRVNYATADPPGGGTETTDGIVKLYAIGQRLSVGQPN